MHYRSIFIVFLWFSINFLHFSPILIDFLANFRRFLTICFYILSNKKYFNFLKIYLYFSSHYIAMWKFDEIFHIEPSNRYLDATISQISTFQFPLIPSSEWMFHSCKIFSFLFETNNWSLLFRTSVRIIMILIENFYHWNSFFFRMGTIK